MYFNSGIRPVDRNKTHKQVHVFQFQQNQCANTVLLLSYLLQCISLHNYALLLFVKTGPDGVQMAHNLGVELFVNFVCICTEAGHICSSAPVRQLFVNEDFFCTTMFSFYLLLNENKISSVICPA